jgi:hypothetical protein
MLEASLILASAPLAQVGLKFADRHGFWGALFLAGFSEVTKSRHQSRIPLCLSDLDAPIFRQPTIVQESLHPFR